MPPPDDRLPAAATLFDVAAMGAQLSDLLLDTISSVRIRYIDYVPGAALTVQYDARSAAAGSPIVEAHATATTTVAGWRTWVYPQDPALPLLAADAVRLTESLGLQPSDSPVTRLAWVPQRRAVLRRGDVVVKLYADPVDLARAERALRTLDGRLPTASLVLADGDRGAVVQTALGGRPLGRDDALRSVDSAVGIMRQLHGLALDDLDDLRPTTLLAAAERPTALAAFAVPELADRIRVLSRQLAATMPDVADVVPVHGDFNIGQLLVDGDRTMVVDVDTLAAGSPAVDIAAYAANLHNGRRGDSDAVAAALTGLAAAYGPPLHDLNWYLAVAMLRRIDRPVRRLKKRWPERTDAMVAAIEGLLARGGRR